MYFGTSYQSNYWEVVTKKGVFPPRAHKVGVFFFSLTYLEAN